ncbi:uncharacterized protein LY89DRAFT_47206 [Mollisia scopiformis]|uniref:Uncharacterized protein n=1 Tax=Mollisia scopiformis TaxID=149040 RepID=A0A194XDY0_MOLSC|nr:uncharacterized protein LY89DRAFT_47206 [Mollisia scopiformis]KUJ18383.1 hypothetical protein LY89DRAFT_47206 [Mollisia scopiformis]
MGKKKKSKQTANSTALTPSIHQILYAIKRQKPILEVTRDNEVPHGLSQEQGAVDAVSVFTDTMINFTDALIAIIDSAASTEQCLRQEVADLQTSLEDCKERMRQSATSTEAEIISLQEAAKEQDDKIATQEEKLIEQDGMLAERDREFKDQRNRYNILKSLYERSLKAQGAMKKQNDDLVEEKNLLQQRLTRAETDGVMKDAEIRQLEYDLSDEIVEDEGVTRSLKDKHDASQEEYDSLKS